MYEQFEKLLNEHGVKAADVAKATGIRHSTFTDWKMGRTNPKIDKLKKIADYFGVTVDFLMNGQQNEYYINDETAEIAQQVFDDPNLRLLFDAAKGVRPENVRLAAEILLRMKETNPDG